MTETATNAEWRKTLPTHLHAIMDNFESLATHALTNNHPYHSVRIRSRDFLNADGYAGRLLGWVIATNTQLGWEYQNTTCNSDNDMWLLFKNPYIFS